MILTIFRRMGRFRFDLDLGYRFFDDVIIDKMTFLSLSVTSHSFFNKKNQIILIDVIRLDYPISANYAVRSANQHRVFIFTSRLAHSK